MPTHFLGHSLWLPRRESIIPEARLGRHERPTQASKVLASLLLGTRRRPVCPPSVISEGRCRALHSVPLIEEGQFLLAAAASPIRQPC